MDIYQLRNCMQVTNYYTHTEGGMIYYIREGKTNIINLTSQELISELIAIGSLDENPDSEQIADYSMSQWDALNIAIRFEAAKDMEKEIDKADIGKAIKNINNDQK